MGNYDDFVCYINRFMPITGVTVYHNGAAITHRSRGRAHNNRTHIRGDRKPIVELTNKARKQMAFVALATGAEFNSMITLTYPAHYSNDGREVKKHLHLMLKWLSGYGVSEYFWFLEFQKRGAPHFHIMTDIREPNIIDRCNLAFNWVATLGYDVTKAGFEAIDYPGGTVPIPPDSYDYPIKIFKVASHPKSWEAVRSKNGARHYILKYATKTYQKKVPAPYQNVGRFWGCSRSVREQIKPIAEFELNEETLRQIATDYDSWIKDRPLIPKIILDLHI